MRDTDIFSKLLGLTEDWAVSSVDLVPEADSVQMVVEHVGRAKCPVCGKEAPIYDHAEERRWRHLDTMQFMTFVACRVPRCNCPEHGVKQLDIPWSGPKSRFTQMFECLAIELLKMTRCQSRTAKILRLGPWQIHLIMRRAVGRGLARRNLGAIHHLSIDEKSFQRGHQYGSVLSDSTGRRVLDVAFGRDEKAARLVLDSLAMPEQVRTITMDMAPSYKNAALDALPQADVIHDRFHVAMILSEAIDQTRRAEQKKRPELKYSRFVWLKNPQNRSEKQHAAFDLLMSLELKTAQVYAFKEVLRHFFEQDDVQEATLLLSDWINQARKTGLPALVGAAKTIEKNFKGLLNYVKWKLTNGFAEGLNSMIQEIKTVARGFRRFENFRIAILFFLGKLELNPCKSP
jgi:transposase